MTGAELRAAILQAAVQGKLVPQDPTDEPASALLERVRDQRRKLVKTGKAKAPKGGESVITRRGDGGVWETRSNSEPVEITDEIPFDIPDEWEWTRVSDVCEAIVDCPHSTPKYLSEETGYVAIDTNCIDDNWHITGWRDLSEETYAQRVARLVPQVGDLVFTREGSIGRSAILNRENVCLGQRVMIMRPVPQLAVQYLQIVLSSPSAGALYKDSQKGTAARHINVKDVCAFLLPLPPLSEQRRIVAKLEELMPMVERYDRLDRERTELNAGIEGAMRASILQAAVQGRLTEQDPADEPASKLLERVREERRALVKAKKAKAPKGGESVIWHASDGTVWEQRGKGKAVDITDEVPFDIPDGWEWCRGTMLLNLLSGIDLKPSEYNDRHRGIPYLTGASNFSEEGLIENRWTEVPKRVSVDGDLLFTCKGTVGAMAYNTFGEAHIARQIMAIRPFGRMSLDYIRVVLSSKVAQIKASAKGVIPGIERETILEQLVPVPPLAEQRRIVAKLDEMLPMTERLGKLVS